MSETRDERAARDFAYGLGVSPVDEDRFDNTFADQSEERKDRDWPNWDS